MPSLQEGSEASLTVSDESPASLPLTIHYQLAMLQQDIASLHEALHTLKKASGMTPQHLLKLIQEGVGGLFQETLDLKLKEFEKKITLRPSLELQEETPFKAKLKLFFPYLLGCLMGASLASGSFYFFSRFERAPLKSDYLARGHRQEARSPLIHHPQESRGEKKDKTAFQDKRPLYNKRRGGLTDRVPGFEND